VCYKVEDEETFFLVEGEWIHEMFLDFILGIEEETYAVIGE
jgi:hypothetical protein